MELLLRLFVIASSCAMVSCGVQKSAAGVDANSGIVIEWDQAETGVAWGGYPRAHRLNDGRLMLVFFNGGGSSYCLSEDNGTNWSGLTTVYQSERWVEDATAGCWEPFVNVLPDGTGQIQPAGLSPRLVRGLCRCSSRGGRPPQAELIPVNCRD